MFEQNPYSTKRMSQTPSQYWIGIDLGTTHTVLAYADQQALTPDIQVFSVPQWVGAEQQQSRPYLPSVQYHLAEVDASLPAIFPAIETLYENRRPIVWGDWALDLGSQTLGRLVASAKSWLSVAGLDANAERLPQAAAPDVQRISPVAACASYLSYLRLAWNQAHPEALLEHQQVVVTLPASFDQQARQQTLAAIHQAGLGVEGKINLLEEPQAAFYHWVWHHRAEIQTHLANVRTILVCDVGGGTTDFSLVRVSADADQAAPQLERVAVGQHLMLGGDNMDHLLVAALQRVYKQSKSGRRRWPRSVQNRLLLECRRLKEAALSNHLIDGAQKIPETLRASVVQVGSQLLGNTWHYDWATSDIQQTLLDGFFPLVGWEDPVQVSDSALITPGLPYEADPAITRHLAAFLRAQGAVECDLNDQGIDAIVFNGGVMQSPLIQQRLLEQLRHWFGVEPKVLGQAGLHEQTDQEASVAHAVAYGAVAWQCIQHQERLEQNPSVIRSIKANTPRSYCLQLETSESQPKAVCLLPKGSEAERWYRLENRVFQLNLGQRVCFKLWASERLTSDLGALVSLDLAHCHVLPMLTVDLTQELAQGAVEVFVEAKINELGLIQVRCLSVDDPEQHHWQFEFENTQADAVSHSAEAEAGAEMLRALLFGRDEKAVKKLRVTLEAEHGEWQHWSLAQLRYWADVLIEIKKSRFKSPAHERVWLQLLGWCLRPGLGALQDPQRIEVLWPLFKEGVQHRKVMENWRAWWAFWRRIAAGLPTECQLACYESVRPWLTEKSWQSRKLLQERQSMGFDELLRFVASLEAIATDERQRLGDSLVANLKKQPNLMDAMVWALGRLGARELLLGEPLSDAAVSPWIETLLTFNWRKFQSMGLASVMMVQGGEGALTKVVQEKLLVSKAPLSWVALLAGEEAGLDKQMQHLLGEQLPMGLSAVEEF